MNPHLGGGRGRVGLLALALVCGVVSVTAQGAVFGSGPAYASPGSGSPAAPGVTGLAVSVPAVASSFVDATAGPTAAGVRRALDPYFALKSKIGPRSGAYVMSAETGEVLYARNSTAVFMPASVTKVLTAAVAVSVLGADTVYLSRRTGGRVFLTPASPDQVVSGNRQSIAYHVEVMLKVSDNELSQALADEAARVSGISFQSLAIALLSSRGIDGSTLVLRDGSGLSRDNRIAPFIPAALILSVYRGGTEDPLWPLLSGLPVAGFDGTLFSRFSSVAASVGKGIVRGKTGTLTGVISLAGLTTTASGDLLVYTFMADRVPPNATGRVQTRNVFDTASAMLSRCGCAS